MWPPLLPLVLPIALAAIVAEAYGELGAYMQALLLGLIAVNETVGPILFRRALDATAETDPEGEEGVAPVNAVGSQEQSA